MRRPHVDANFVIANCGHDGTVVLKRYLKDVFGRSDGRFLIRTQSFLHSFVMCRIIETSDACICKNQETLLYTTQDQTSKKSTPYIDSIWSPQESRNVKRIHHIDGDHQFEPARSNHCGPAIAYKRRKSYFFSFACCFNSRHKAPMQSEANLGRAMPCNQSILYGNQVERSNTY